MYNCEILADSKSPQGNRLTTMKITFPRMMLAEMNTHRMFSRNSASSRAIPFKKMVKMVEENPFIPIAWQKDHKGMQGTEYLADRKHENAVYEWLKARNYAVKQASMMNNDGVTKQLCNRLLEPFMWHTVIVTATEWENFFKLRCPQYRSPVDRHFLHKSKKDCISAHSNPINLDLMDKMTTVDWLQINESQAEIHIQAIAELMWDEFNSSTPKQLQAGEWHIPFGDNIDYKRVGYTEDGLDYVIHNDEEDLVKIATARCARISYETLGDNPKIDYETDIRLYDRLASMKHWSPFEHVARAMSTQEYMLYTRTVPGKADPILESEGHEVEIDSKQGTYTMQRGWCRNFKGFIQYRSLVDKF